MLKKEILAAIGWHIAKLVYGVCREKHIALYKEEIAEIADTFEACLDMLSRRDRDAEV